MLSCQHRSCARLLSPPLTLPKSSELCPKALLPASQARTGGALGLI